MDIHHPHLNRVEEMSRKEERGKHEANSEPSSKRRKVHHRGDASSGKPQRRGGAIVTGDELRWKEVPLPDRLDDAEGFFGLEEIDDVEVLREEGVQRIRFRVCTNQPSYLGRA